MKENKKNLENGNFLENLPLVTIVKDKAQRPLTDNQGNGNDYRVIKWSELSTEFSKEGLGEGLKHTTDLEELAEWVHAYWVSCLEYVWELLAEDGGEFYTLDIEYTAEKRASHNSMRVGYDQLSREDQLKDIFVIKTMLTEEEWFFLGGDFYEDEFEEHSVGW
jgi:hypothetical protein